MSKTFAAALVGLAVAAAPVGTSEKIDRAVQGHRGDGRLGIAEPGQRRHRQRIVQRGGAPGHRARPGDPIEYGTYTWHTNLDTYERIIEEDVKKSAMAIASALYHLAMREEMLPRFSKETMPPPNR